MTGAPNAAQERWPWPADMALLALLGAAQNLAYVHSAWWPLQLVSIAVLAWRASWALTPRAALCGWSFGFGWLAGGVWWLFISMHRYGGLPAWMAVLAVALLCAALASLLALATALYALRRPRSAWLGAATFAALWMAAELARGIVFTGFPWVASGYAHIDAPLAALAPWIGVYGIGGAAAGVGALLAAPCMQCDHPPSRRFWLAPALAVAAIAALGAIGAREFTQAGTTLRVALLQTNVAQDEKFAAAYLGATLEWLAQALASAPGDLVLAPETAMPLLPGQLTALDPQYWPALNRLFDGERRAALVGVPLGDYDTGYTNSVVALGAGAAYRYDKLHLVPFGEFIPTGLHWFTRMMNIPLGDFNRGVRNPPSFGLRGERIAPNICYEDLFGEELAWRFADEARAPTILANVSNIAWFGDTIAIQQHLNISRMRTLELQRPMLRATNTGATVIVDHTGRITAQLQPFTRGTLVGSVQGRSGITPYVWWVSRFSLWPLALLALSLAAIGWRSAARVAAREP